ncbi:Folate-sensitive fragile site protein [Citrus sinensis]|uniref:Folate-sensitive fragile site protein n=1 Tax=Citrus sinensis TaxID=2711 RepID=A0ACB8LM52_CITSI|nr:Folate-sensitive fragile site protein [Citrus sinensis]
MASFGSLKSEIFDREERKQQYQAQIRGLNAHDRHKKFLKDYVAFYGKEKPMSLKLPVKTDQDTLREGFRYCIADMSHYKSGKVNFTYVEAGENKQALVKLVTCERCAEKLHYKRRKEKEQLDRREKEENKRKRYQSRSDHDTDEEYEEREERRKISERRDKKEHKRKREISLSDDDTEEKHDRKGLGKKEKEELKRNRDESGSDSDSNKVYKSSKEKRKERKASSLAGNHSVNNDDNFDEFMEGMFP